MIKYLYCHYYPLKINGKLLSYLMVGLIPYGLIRSLIIFQQINIENYDLHFDYYLYFGFVIIILINILNINWKKSLKVQNDLSK